MSASSYKIRDMGVARYSIMSLRDVLGCSVVEVESAFWFASGAHAGQVRSGSGLDYVIHPAHVACIYAKYCNWVSAGVQAALLHDTVEDTSVSVAQISDIFGSFVAQVVKELSTPSYEGVEKADVVFLEAVRLSEVSSLGQTIKAADMYSNVRDMRVSRPSRFSSYLDEKFVIFSAMKDVDPALGGVVSNMFAEFGAG